jgi:CCR4-NOT transcription complex subunit 2
MYGAVAPVGAMGAGGPGWGAPPSGYGAPPSGYGAPPSGYGAPYGAPPSFNSLPGYGAMAGYGAPPGAPYAALQAAARGAPRAAPAAAKPPGERYGLLGLLAAIRMSDADLSTLALGTDLTTLGLNLNSPEPLHKTFAGPWADAPCRPEPELGTPAAYLQQPPYLTAAILARFSPESLFYVFYSCPGEEAQLAASEELASRGWSWHTEMHAWLIRAPDSAVPVKTERGERGSWVVFDASTWTKQLLVDVTL